MNSKTIKKVLKKKFNSWVESIQDEFVKNLVKQNTIITGGSIVSMLLGEDVKDFDIYFRNKETTKAVAEYYVKQFNELNKIEAFVLDGAKADKYKDTPSVMLSNITPDRIKIIVESKGVAAENESTLDEPFEDIYDVLNEADNMPADKLMEDTKTKYRPVFLSSNAITLTDKIQLVVRFYGEPGDIHENYDYVHCTNSWTSWDNQLTLRQEALEAILSKTLIYQGSKYPLCSVVRSRKFIQRGWHINAGQYLKMLFQISQLDLQDINVLEDQLIGVDSAYFMALIERLRSKEEKDPNFTLTSDYLVSIIDKIF